jgi:hypothetical protein
MTNHDIRPDLSYLSHAHTPTHTHTHTHTHTQPWLSQPKLDHNATYRPEATNKSSNSGCSTGEGNGRLTVKARRFEDGADMLVSVGVPGGGGSGCPATGPVGIAAPALAQAAGVSIIPAVANEAADVDSVGIDEETAVGTLADKANEACVGWGYPHTKKQQQHGNTSQDAWNVATFINEE